MLKCSEEIQNVAAQSIGQHSFTAINGYKHSFTARNLYSSSLYLPVPRQHQLFNSIVLARYDVPLGIKTVALRAQFSPPPGFMYNHCYGPWSFTIQAQNLMVFLRVTITPCQLAKTLSFYNLLLLSLISYLCAL